MSSSANSVYLVVTKDVPVENQEKWLKMAKELSSETWKEDGCIMYTFVKSKGNPTRFFILEEWASQAHLDAHAVSEHFKRLVPAMDAISSMPAIDFCGDSLPDRFNDAVPGKILILYDSSSNCTEKMADLIAEGALLVDYTEVRIRAVPGEPNHWDRSPETRVTQHPIATYEDIYWADGIACGSPTNLGGISWRMKKFWDEFSQAGGWGGTDGKLACSFTSSGGHGGGGEIVNQAMNDILLNFGFSVFGITDYVSFKQTMHYGAVCAKAPRDDNDRMPCLRQGTRLAEFVGLYIHGRQELHPIKASKAADLARWGFPGIPPRDADINELIELNRRPVHAYSGRSWTQRAATNGQGCTTAVVNKTALIFTRALDYIHGSSSAAASWAAASCTELGYKVIVSDDNTLLEIADDGAKKANVPDFDLIVFVNNSGEIFNPDPKCNLLAKHIAAGKGIVGIHAALAAFLCGQDASGETIMHPTTPVFENIFKTHFRNHPPVQEGQVSLDTTVAKLLGLSTSVPERFAHTDEFFNFTYNPCVDPTVQVLAYVDESSYNGGLMGEKHPLVRIIWVFKLYFCILYSILIWYSIIVV